jgi:3-oxoacyl-[acyl-carrier-protein] synthase II
MRRIVVTGLGAVTPLAANVEASWSRLLAGRSGIRRLPDDVVGDLPAKIGGVVPSLEEDPERASIRIPSLRRRTSAR